jgi:digeranylgeranylglycerophospholipid reductase
LNKSDSIFSKNYDIIVVGTGPAGGAAALRAASAGLRVLVLDRKAEVGVPVRCGEAVSEDVLEDLGLPLKDSYIRNRVHGGMFESSAGRTLEVTTSNTGLILNRIKFEQYIMDEAVSSGAKLSMNTNVTALSKRGVRLEDGTSVKGDVIIGADGVDSQVGYWAGIDTTLKPADIGICGQYVVSDFAMRDDVVEMYWGQKFAGGCGYAWVFPRGDGSANVGLGVAGVHVPKSGVKPLIDNFIKLRCGKKYKKAEFGVGAIPQSGVIKSSVKNNVMLVGDAARLTIPLTGSGIGHALYSGKLAVEVVLEMREKGEGIDYLQNYDLRWRPRLSKKLRRAYKIKEKFRENPASIERMFKILKPLVVLHRMFPNFIEKVALRDLRY